MSNISNLPPASHAPLLSDAGRVPRSSLSGKTSSRLVWISLAVLALLCMLGVGLLALGVGIMVQTVAGPSTTADQYYSAIKKQDYAMAYSYLGSRLQTVYDQQAFTRSAQHNDAASGKVTSVSFSGVPTGDPASVYVTVTRMSGSASTVHLEWRQEGGTWKITSLDRI